jgi:hypothetical protein
LPEGTETFFSTAGAASQNSDVGACGRIAADYGRTWHFEGDEALQDDVDAVGLDGQVANDEIGAIRHERHALDEVKLHVSHREPSTVAVKVLRT